MPLPTQKSPAQPRMGKVLIFALPKIGKSTLVSSVDPDHTLLLDVEDGLSAIEGYKHPIRSWGKVTGSTGEGRNARPVFDDNSLMGVGQLLAKGDHPFKVVAVDTADALAQLCSDHVLTQLGANAGQQGFVHASDFDYGKGWSAITQEWQTRMAALARLVPSLILISHADRRTRTTRAGAEIDVFSTNLGPKGVKEWTMGFVDHVLFMQMVDTDDGPVRAIRTQQGVGWEAGGRTVAGGPQLPDPILLPDAQTSGTVLREALESVTNPYRSPAPEQDELDAEARKPAAKKKPAAKPGAGAKEQLTA